MAPDDGCNQPAIPCHSPQIHRDIIVTREPEDAMLAKPDALIFKNRTNALPVPPTLRSDARAPMIGVHRLPCQVTKTLGSLSVNVNQQPSANTL